MTLTHNDLFIEPSFMDLDAKWERVPIAEIFATELLPIMDNHPPLQKVFEEAVAHWVSDSPWMKKRVGKWSYASHTTSPFMMTYSDGAVTHVDRAIEEAETSVDPLARAYYSAMDLLCDEADLGLPKSTIRVLEKKLSDIARQFEPQRDEARYWSPLHACRTFNVLPAWCLAREWRPDADWRILDGELHTTVVAPNARLVFDLVLADMPDVDPLEFACRPAPQEKVA